MAKNIFRKFSFFIIIIIIGFLPLFSVKADFPPTEIPNFLGTNDFNELVGKIIDWVAKIGGSIAIIMIIYSGLLFMTAGGDEEKVTKARKALTWALVGLAVLLIGKGWVYIVQDILGKK